MPTIRPTPIHLADFKSLLAPRPRDAHKGLFGHVLVIGGDYGLAGAIRLAGEAALRVGAGLVSIATRPEHVAAIVSGRPEIMAHGIKKTSELKPLLAKATVIILGPGLGQSPWSQQLLKQALAAPQPKVIDADALNLLALQPKQSANWVLTPHPGEAARLLNSSTAFIQADRTTAAKQLQQKYQGVIVLKGAGSLVCTATTLSLCQAGNPGMASGGMGDVLSGVIGGLIAQQFNLRHAAELGVCLHAGAGDLAAAQAGERGLIASDLMLYLHKLINVL
jgi:NAD(P)H-hydrate epimerase